MSISLTPAAIQHIKDMITRRGRGMGFRLSMKKYGCNGFGYVPDVIDEINPSDIEIKTITEMRVFVDAKFADALNGTIIDYVKKGLGQNQLLFNNPNAEGECGCGESVNLKDPG
ncbi:MAG: hypothetical protein A3F10_01650 [Coxiella sp. RIFCSPHIGHO2_12_FULL_42_15]|nr:MAG: hypothetical protein A3F10_01650 [Coxiella sp. RIFCSPHIGHO2_12_FULL_42_15]